MLSWFTASVMAIDRSTSDVAAGPPSEGDDERRDSSSKRGRILVQWSPYQKGRSAHQTGYRGSNSVCQVSGFRCGFRFVDGQWISLLSRWVKLYSDDVCLAGSHTD